MLKQGFEPEEPESVMIGQARALADVQLPAGITLRQIHHERHARRMSAMQREVFGDVDVDEMTVALR